MKTGSPVLFGPCIICLISSPFWPTTTIFSCALITFSQIVIWDPANLQSLHTLSTLGGFAYSLSISTLDPGTLGIGVGDNMLRVWQTASSQNPYETLTLWQGIKSKVMVVSDLGRSVYYLCIINANNSVCFKLCFGLFKPGQMASQ